MKKNIFKHTFSALSVCIFLLLGYGSYDDETTSSTPTEVKIELPKMTDDEALSYFKNQWDSVKLNKVEGFPQYKTFSTNLSEIIHSMTEYLQKSDTKIDLEKSTNKVNKLRIQYLKSKKYKDAQYNYQIYGQPFAKTELRGACRAYLEEYANDPSSIEIEDYRIEGQSNNGWVVSVKYRGSNAYGAIVLNYATFDIKFNSVDEFFYVAGVN